MVLRGLAWALLGCVLLFGVGAYSLSHWLKAPYLQKQIVAQVQKTTGRPLTINGGMEVHWGLFPRLSLTEASLGNAPFDAAGPMVQVKTLNLQIALLPLVFGDVVIDGLDVEGMTLRLTIDPQGRNNWTLTPAPKDTPQNPSTTDTAKKGDTPPAPHLMIRRLSVHNSVILLTDQRHAGQAPETLTLSRLDLKTQGQGYGFSLEALLRQTPLSLSGEVSDTLALLSQTGESGFALKGTLADVNLEATGLLTKRQGTLTKAEGALTLNATAWPKAFPLPDLPPLRLNTEILYTPEAITWTQAKLTSLGATVTSNGTYRTQEDALDGAIQMDSAGSPDLATRLQQPWLHKPLTIRTRLQKKGEAITWSKLNATLGQGTIVESDGALRWPTGAAAPTLVQADVRSPMVILEDLKTPPAPPVVASPEPEADAPKPQAPAAAPPAPAAPVTTTAASWRQRAIAPALESGVRGVVTGRFDHVRETAKGADLVTNVTLRATQQETLAVEAKGAFVGGGAIRLLTSLTPQPPSPKTPAPQPEALLNLLLNITHPNVGALLKTTGVSAAGQGGAAHLLAHLKATGATVQNLLETLSGDVTLGMGPAIVHQDALLSSFLSGDLAQALLGDQKTLPVSCLATKWPFVQGVATTPVTLLESPAVRVWGTGTLNLARNTVAMTLTPTPKDPKLALLAVPVSVSGALDSPRVSLGKQGVETLTGTVLSLIQNKGKLPAPTTPLPANDTICANVLIPLKDGRFEVRGVKSPSPQPSSEQQQPVPLKKKEILEGLRGLWR